jgi:3-mercaptopyruvate sulfurtransferase SseA
MENEKEEPMNIVNRVVRFACILAFSSLFALAFVFPFPQEQTASPDVAKISPEELKKLIESDSPDILVVSNDPQESYDEGHIMRAVSFPWEMEVRPPRNLPRNKTLVLYCSCAHEEDSTDMAGKLRQFGYRNVKVLEGGYLRWQELKYPIEKTK